VGEIEEALAQLELALLDCSMSFAGAVFIVTYRKSAPGVLFATTKWLDRWRNAGRNCVVGRGPLLYDPAAVIAGQEGSALFG